MILFIYICISNGTVPVASIIFFLNGENWDTTPKADAIAANFKSFKSYIF